MDAIKFRDEFARMCASYETCSECVMPKECRECCSLPSNYTTEMTSRIVKAVEDWAAAHPVTTRADLFKQIVPSTDTAPSGELYICPSEIDETFVCNLKIKCDKCRKIYWLKEVQNGR